jgi:hypothetical protein
MTHVYVSQYKHHKEGLHNRLMLCVIKCQSLSALKTENISAACPDRRQMFPFSFIVLWFHFNKWDIFHCKAFVTYPLCINFLCQQVVCCFRQPCAITVEPKVTSTFTQNCLIVVMDLFMANSTWVDWWSIWVRWIEYHRLIGWVDFPSTNWGW